MNYMGGKWRQGPQIAAHVAALLQPSDARVYYEPFCGAMGSAHRVAGVLHSRMSMVLSDVSEPLITMWRAVLDGWNPPDVVTQETYDRYKRARDPNDPMTAYCGFGMSFGGKWFGGYARNGVERHYALNARRSVLLKASALLKASVLLKASDYRDVTPRGQVIYLDPPYSGRTKAYHFDSFSDTEFWNYARHMSRDNAVIVTGFSAPSDFRKVYCWGDTVVRHHSSRGADGTTESIYAHDAVLEEARVAV